MKTCYDCQDCMALGEGDFFCDKKQEIVIADYAPTDYFGCEEEKK